MQSLQNHLLIAMPSLKDAYFSRSVTYICEHSETGAMGIVINQPIEMKIHDLLAQVSDDLKDKNIHPDTPVYAGGPVNSERGFILHTPQEIWKSSLQLSDDFMVTTSKDILESIGTKLEPENYLICLGYAGWQEGQLEQELLENSWITIPAEKELVFNTPIRDRWQKATEKLGFSPWQLSDDVGHA
ncbi:YqgE/AlgH family protein [Catenovulum sp. 2E275]|uniref:YqgE/AlgH family protein n=1 Tax=Catenovulum sp. 2E275 TaxID=2980497 RepID=UPI0021D3D793|nr:YqgE/AlgH family protein [Catenovulum sp. 2E275]MCU4674873.1 YqgE/AlgH family protein [Catenovulum sp. 2E275]